MTNPPDREVAVFSAARRLPIGTREAYLDEACAGDAALRQHVEELIKASEDAGAFLHSPAVNPSGRVGTIRLELPPSEKAGDQIGRYKLLQQIGEGGCGVVYMAEQEQPVKRRVALKVIKLGMDTKSVIARFEAERQALALMDHPNIAKVLDAGATDTGRPYFVMELVRGIPITDYCDQHNLSTQARLDLFMEVCRAVQHAHQKGIIHRDIKPSNILVTMNDGLPMPKVIDFGIAKATQGKLTDHTVFTAFEQFIGTPAYMSPEQAEMSALDIDTRSDIYSLGVLLYELLTGKTPFDAKELLKAGLDEMRRQIREQEPARPSTRLGTMLAADLTTVAGHRQALPPKLINLVRGDLDWIVMKALEKDRTRRYETANGFAADIQRHLNCEPVVARPQSGFYRLQKAVRRHKGAFAAAGAVFLTLVTGLAVSIWLWQRAETARANEAKLRQKLEVRVNIAQARTLLNNKEYDAAEKLLNAINPDLIEPDAIHASLRRQLGWQRVLQNQWSNAAADYAVVLQVDGTAWDRDVAGDYYNYATAIVEASDKAGYERFRQPLIMRHKSTTDPSGAEFWCCITLLTSADEKMMTDLGPLYDVAANRQDYPIDRKQEEMSENYLRRALVDYRRGNYSKADELVQRCLHPLKDPTIVPTALAIRAMIHHQMNMEDEGRKELESARLVIDPVIKNGPSAFNARQLSQQGRYFEWVQADIFLREATILIEGRVVLDGQTNAADSKRLN